MNWLAFFSVFGVTGVVLLVGWGAYLYGYHMEDSPWIKWSVPALLLIGAAFAVGLTS